MKLNIIQDKILDIFKTANDKLLRDYVKRVLKQDRARAMDAFGEMIVDLQGRYRLKLLEIFMEDGQPDMIPLFIEAVKHEPNLLYAKSMLFIYSNFEHYQAYEAVDALEPLMTGEMKPAYDKAVAKLGAKFRHRYYISEFLNHADDEERIAHAAAMMVTEFHPDFIPFLNEEIQQPKRAYREHGLRVLNQVGDETSVDALFELATTAFVEKEKAAALVQFLQAQETAQLELPKIFMILAAMAGWPPEETQKHLVAVQEGQVDGVAGQLAGSFQFGSRRFDGQMGSYVDKILQVGGLDDLDQIQLVRAYDHYLIQQNEIIEKVFLDVGEIGHRLGMEGLFKKTDAYIPDDEPMRTAFLFSFMGGYRSHESREQLLSYLNTEEPEDFLIMVLEALSHYRMEEVHPNLLGMTGAEVGTGPRRRALALLAQWNLAASILPGLLRSQSEAVREDAVAAAAEFQIAGAAPLLIEMLSEDVSAELKAGVIRVLEHFPGEATVAAIQPFLEAAHPAAVRESAVSVLIEIGDEDRFGRIVAAMSGYPEAERREVLDIFLERLREILEQSPGEAPPGLLAAPDFWVQILNDGESEALRLRALAVLEAVTWWPCPEPAVWCEAMKGVLDQLIEARKYDEKRRLRLLSIRVDEAVTRKDRPTEPPRRKKTLRGLIDDLDTAVHYDRVRAFRQLSLIFKPEMLGEAGQQSRLVRLVSKFFDDYQGAPDLMRIAMTLAGKIAHPDLTDRIRVFLDDADSEMKAFAKAALSHLGEDWERDGAIHRIFIMEDAVMMTKMLSRFLAKAGFEVMCANDTETGLEALAGYECDLLILDYFMSKMDGVAFLSEARKRGIAPPWAIFITSTREERIIREINELDVHGLLLKPFSVEELIDRINQLAVR